ncbi:TetR/AcrR family transcriptional regulator [Acaryochloris marina]|uniref:TetR/AcrR family transcriptional regulator n=1 Tax=Acaryochloris marina TaxID=155978 RepID=UPI000A0344CE|nr:TetR/AcrR family transcriptional regulator [Acaryochloris marina]
MLEAAQSLFSELAYEEIGLNRIAREVGISKAKIYRYFSTREEIFLVIYEAEQIKSDFELKSGVRFSYCPAANSGRLGNTVLQGYTDCYQKTVGSSISQRYFGCTYWSPLEPIRAENVLR